VLFKLFAVSKNTFTEAIRQPVYAVILAFAIFMFILSPSVSMYTLDDDIKMLKEIGLSTLFLAGLFIAIFSAGTALTEEIETKTITSILSKPIARPTFIIGKFLGVAAAVTLAHYIFTIALIMIVRHGVMSTASDERDWTVLLAAGIAILLPLLISAFMNYAYDWSFSGTAIFLIAVFSTGALIFLSLFDQQWQFNPHDNHIEKFDIYASILLLFAVLVLVALAIMFSTRFNIILTLTFCVATFLLGLIIDYIYIEFLQTQAWASVIRWIVPNLQVFWISDAIYEGTQVPGSYLLMTAGYAGLYITGIVMLAIAMFQRRQVG
jgi:ABC-2 type transport system permease protein